MKYRRIAALLLLCGAVAIVLVLLQTRARDTQTEAVVVTYACNEGKTITARYYEGAAKASVNPDQPPTPGGRVELTLDHGRMMTLLQTISADGVRYANADESFVFWSKGNGALVLEHNIEMSYTGCIVVAPEPAGQHLPQIYSNGGMGFSLRLPAGYTVDEAYRYQALGPGKDIFGTKFTIPKSVALNTNLGDDTYISVEEIPKIRDCNAELFLDYSTAHIVTDGDTTYSVASSTGAGAGNRYEETVYALPGTNPCIAVRYYIHYSVFDNYPRSSSVHEFDKRALLAQFDAIRRTLTVVQ